MVCEVRDGEVNQVQLREIASNIKSSMCFLSNKKKTENKEQRTTNINSNYCLGVSSGLSVAVWDVVIIPARTIAKTSSGKIQRQQCKANCIRLSNDREDEQGEMREKVILK